MILGSKVLCLIWGPFWALNEITAESKLVVWKVVILHDEYMSVIFA
jgi:hypothetical protein